MNSKLNEWISKLTDNIYLLNQDKDNCLENEAKDAIELVIKSKEAFLKDLKHVKELHTLEESYRH